MLRWRITNVLVAGRRVSGESNGRDADEAVRRLAATEARSRGADVAAAIAGAVADRHKEVAEIKPQAPPPADEILADPGRADWSEWPARFGARAVVEAAERSALEKEYTGRDDEFWDVEWVPDGSVDGDKESGHSSFRKSGYSGVQCTGFACEILAKLGPQRVQVYGFSREDNPGSSIAQGAGGHDFAVVDGRYIVDPWLVDIEGDPRGVFDLEDPADAPEIARIYGERSAWKATRRDGAALRFGP